MIATSYGPDIRLILSPEESIRVTNKDIQIWNGVYGKIVFTIYFEEFLDLSIDRYGTDVINVVLDLTDTGDALKKNLQEFMIDDLYLFHSSKVENMVEIDMEKTL